MCEDCVPFFCKCEWCFFGVLVLDTAGVAVANVSPSFTESNDFGELESTSIGFSASSPKSNKKNCVRLDLITQNLCRQLPSLISLSSSSIWFHNDVCDKAEFIDRTAAPDDDGPAVDDANILLSICDESTYAAFHISNCACKMLPIWMVNEKFFVITARDAECRVRLFLPVARVEWNLRRSTWRRVGRSRGTATRTWRLAPTWTAWWSSWSTTARHRWSTAGDRARSSTRYMSLGLPASHAAAQVKWPARCRLAASSPRKETPAPTVLSCACVERSCLPGIHATPGGPAASARGCSTRTWCRCCCLRSLGSKLFDSRTTARQTARFCSFHSECSGGMALRLSREVMAAGECSAPAWWLLLCTRQMDKAMESCAQSWLDWLVTKATTTVNSTAAASRGYLPALAGFAWGIDNSYRFRSTALSCCRHRCHPRTWFVCPGSCRMRNPSSGATDRNCRRRTMRCCCRSEIDSDRTTTGADTNWLCSTARKRTRRRRILASGIQLETKPISENIN